MKPHSSFKHIIYLTLAFFALQSVAPSFAHISTNSTFKQIAAMLAPGEKMLICSADGFKWLTKEELQRIPADTHNKSGYKCSLCYVATHSIVADGSAKNSPPPRLPIFKRTRTMFAVRDNVVLSARITAHSTRAPPIA